MGNDCPLEKPGLDLALMVKKKRGKENLEIIMIMIMLLRRFVGVGAVRLIVSSVE